MEIKRVKIGYLKDLTQTGIIENGKTVYRLSREIIGEKICFIDEKFAVDSEDFNNKYELITRDEYNRIINKIDSNTIYALESEELNKKGMFKYKIKMRKYQKTK